MKSLGASVELLSTVQPFLCADIEGSFSELIEIPKINLVRSVCMCTNTHIDQSKYFRTFKELPYLRFYPVAPTPVGKPCADLTTFVSVGIS